MIDEHEKFQGVVLRQIIAAAEGPVVVRPFRIQGRINSFILNDAVGVFIKHSTKRMSPWAFTFHADQISDLRDLEADVPVAYLSFVCGSDGVVTIGVVDFYEISGSDVGEQAWVRITRPRRSMYGISGNRAELLRKVSRGVAPITRAIAR